jgi:chemotaxis protein MotB
MTRRKGAQKAENHERWLITYADLITLLLVFFIVLYAGSQDDSKKFAVLAFGLRSAFHNVADNGAGGNSPVFDGTGSSNAGGPAQELSDFNALSAIIEQYALQAGVGSQVNLRRETDRIVIGLTGDLLFTSGRAQLNPAAGPILDVVAGSIKNLPNQVRVEGHTDSVPAGGAEFASNWELSSARATAVLRYLVDSDHLPGDRLYAAGYADTRPRADNATPAGRAQNRRAEIVVLYPPAAEPAFPTVTPAKVR